MKKQSHRAMAVLVIAAVLAALTGCVTTTPPASTSQGQVMSSGPPPSEAEKLWRQAEQQRNSGNLSAAIPIWERIAKNYPDNLVAAKALYQLGLAHLEQGQPDRALQFLDYAIYTYPKWEGLNLAQMARLKALAASGKKKQAMKEALPLWNASSGQPEVQLGVSRLMGELYASTGDLETACDWVSSGSPLARTPEEKKSLAQVAVGILKNAGESDVQRLLKKNPGDFMRPFLELRLAQIQSQKGKPDEARERYRALLRQYPQHPVAPEIHAALRGVHGTVNLPLNADRVGCLLPLNGPNAKFGQMAMKGIGLANEDWSAAHPDQRVNLVVRDAQNDQNLAVKSFEELARNEGALGVIGPLGAQAAKAVGPVASQWSVPLLALTQKEEDTGDNPYVLNLLLDNRDMVRTLVKYCRERLGYTRFAALYPDDRYGQKLSKVFADVVREQGGNLLASIPYKEKATDFKEPIQKLMTVAKQNVSPSGVDSTPFEALFIPDQVQTVSLIAPQLPYYNVVGATLLGTNLWGEGPLVQVGGSFVEQAIFATPFYSDSESPKVRAFKERYQSVYHTSPSYLEAQAYDALMLFLHARSTLRPNSLDRASLLQNLLQTRGYEGVAGTYSFSPDGSLERSYFLLQVLNGQLSRISR